MSTPGSRSFTIIGENIHATRSLARSGRHVVTVDGSEQVAFTDARGESRTMPLAAPIAAGTEFAAGKVKHIRNAILLGIAPEGLAPADLCGRVGPVAAAVGRDYLIASARRQEAAGARYLDINVDEVTNDDEVRAAVMAWLVRLLETEVGVPLALDSSSAAALRAGSRSSHRPFGALLLNSASAERIDVLDLAIVERSPVVLSAAGRGVLPSDAAGRVAGARAIVSAAARLGIPIADMHVDLLVVPVAVDPGAGAAYLDAVREIRAEFGPDIHITGGLSNVSYGLPNRRLLNDAFLALCMDAGVDSGILDPTTTGIDRMAALDRSAAPFALASDALTGTDAYAAEYLTAYRAGLLVEVADRT